MAATDFWINLPVKDVARAKAFFSALGFTFNTHYGDRPDSASLLLGNKGIVLMLFQEAAFAGFCGNAVADTAKGNEILISFDASSREEVDEVLRKAEAAGGTVYGKPSDQGWMYGGGFVDPDGHRWNVLHMDMSKMPSV